MVIPKIAVLQARSGDPVAALGSFRQMLNASRRSADLMFASHGIGSLIALFERIGRTQAAARLHGFLSPMFDTSAFLAEFPQIIARLRRELGDATFDAERRKGEEMEQHEAAEYALAQITNALAALGVNDEKSVRETLH
jgi:hypothetical protein